MKVEQSAAKRARTHQRYYLKNGTPVPGVTTVLGVLAKPALIPWANKLGLQGIEVTKYVDVLAEIGTIAHSMILAHLKNEKFDPDNLPRDLIDKAENCFLSYLQWEKNHKIEPILCEVPLVSERYKFGGTVDFYGKVDGVCTVKDFKTGSGIYPEYWYQVAAYRELLEENGKQVEVVSLLQIPRGENEGFGDPASRVNTNMEWSVFFHCLEIYRLRRLAA